MSGLTFTLRGEPNQRLDLSRLTARHLAGLGEREIGAIAIGTSRERLTVGDAFAIGFGDLETITFTGGSERFDRIGEGLDGGAIRVDGAVGQQVGRSMVSGTITVTGAAGPFAGSGMLGGTLTIEGDAGDDLGGPLAGETTGLRGGTIQVLGSAGARAGDRMRRGTILVQGDAGDHAGSRMIAGTLVVGGRAGRYPGMLMKRGTLVLAGGASAIGPTFLDNGPADLIILRLMARAFAVPPFASGLFDGGSMRRLGGDTAMLGLGEIFLPLS
ncbi:formylmethanofuran dehydrogenase subunit C [Aureimonas sp. SA4125]|uniref:formylmethanofuran dehydrogenase subunit C n=1 Tax=Aureimonas sp. SA4125 TaxID=2826993 RepID=UPI001CC7CC90|nr:formylmethanofuran dehydrogenase subunit C [Aureimonas sp. SA4125]BDA86303.1 formylmethanofuran dehydrogenase subunit C [Aureimonas sp. SA4125]